MYFVLMTSQLIFVAQFLAANVTFDLGMHHLPMSHEFEVCGKHFRTFVALYGQLIFMHLEYMSSQRFGKVEYFGALGTSISLGRCT